MTNNAQEAIDVDNIIQRLLEVRGSRPGRQVQLAEHEIKGLCVRAKEIFMSQPILLELEAPIKICGKQLWRFKFLHEEYFVHVILRTYTRRSFIINKNSIYAYADIDFKSLFSLLLSFILHSCGLLF
jgi:hypothetical protein